MAKFLVILAALACMGAAHQQQQYTADKNWLMRQKSLYELFWHIDQPTSYHPDLYQIAKSWSIENNIDHYSDPNVVTEFLARFKHGFLRRGEICSIMNKDHLEDMMSFFHLLFSAKDYDAFYNTAVWGRFHLNEKLYLYSLSIAIIHRPDTKYMRLPPLYEVAPQYFFNNDVIQKAHRVKMGDTEIIESKKNIGGVDHMYLYANYSNWYLNRDYDHEWKLNYFHEDVGLNYYYFLFVNDYPFWMKSKMMQQTEGIRGELYLYGHKQLLARYYMERLSNDLGELEYVDWDKRIMTGYYPTINHANGLPFPDRPTWSHIPVYKYKYIREVEEIEAKISDAITSGYALDTGRMPYSIKKSQGLNTLGNIIEGNADSLNPNYYGSLDHMARKILGFSLEPASKHYLAPSALEMITTSMRDPIFYRMYKKIILNYIKYNSLLPSYTHKDLEFPGVKIESVTIDKLTTYFDYFDSLLNNAIAVHGHKEAQSMLIKARQHRLNHKPFTYHLTINSDKNTKATVRVFLGPKYDVHGHELEISDNYMNFLQMDQWIVDLKSGSNKIERSSHESIFVAPDEMASDMFYKKLQKAIDGGEAFTYPEQLYGFPDRLILPKGKRDGMPFKFFFYVCNFSDDQSIKMESRIWGSSTFDLHPMGFPLDRPVYAHNFTLPNMYFKDVMIYHKGSEEMMNLTV